MDRRFRVIRSSLFIVLAMAGWGRAESPDVRLLRSDVLGDPLPPGAVSRLGSARLRHGGPVSFVRYALGGQAIVSVGFDGAIRLWDAQSGQLARTIWTDVRPGNWRGYFRSLPDVLPVAISPDGRLLLSALGDGAILWDLGTGFPVRRVQPFVENCSMVALAADGRTAAAAHEDRRRIEIWDLEKGTQLGKLETVVVGPASSAQIERLEFMPSGKTVGAGFGFSDFLFWNIETGKAMEENPESGSTGVWDAASLKRLQGLPIKVFAGLSFSPDGIHVATKGPGTGILVWKLDSRQPTLLECRGLCDFCYSPDGKTIAAATESGCIRAWDSRTAKETTPAGHRAAVRGIAVHRAADMLATVADDGSMRLWETRSGRELARYGRDEGATWPCEERMRGIAFAVDGQSVLSPRLAASAVWTTSADANMGATPGPPAPVALPNLASLKSSGIGTFTVGGKWLACRGSQWIGLVDSASGSEHHIATAPLDQDVGFVAGSADGKLLAVAAVNYNIGPGWRSRCHMMVYRTDTGTKIHEWDLGRRQVLCAAFAPDASVLAATDGRAVWLWDLAGGRERFKFTFEPEIRAGRSLCEAIAFSTDGRMLAVAHRSEISVWETASCRERIRLKGHTGYVTSLAFDRSSRFLASGADDTTVLYWDLAEAVLSGWQPMESLERPWRALESADPNKAFAASCALIRGGEESVAFLTGKLRRSNGPRAAELAALRLGLNSDRFDVRERAERDLKALGDLAVDALRHEVALPQSPEAERRAQALIDDLEGPWPSPRRLRELRAVEILERIGGASAVKALQELAASHRSGRLTREAREACERLNDRS